MAIVGFSISALAAITPLVNAGSAFIIGLIGLVISLASVGVSKRGRSGAAFAIWGIVLACLAMLGAIVGIAVQMQGTRYLN